MRSLEKPAERFVLTYFNLAIIFIVFAAIIALLCCWAFIPHIPIAL